MTPDRFRVAYPHRCTGERPDWLFGLFGEQDLAVTKEDRQRVITEFRRGEKDTGSCEVQVALLTERIKHLTEHMKAQRKDFHSRRGLNMLVSQRNRLLRYLRRRDFDRYKALIEKLGLRR